MRIGIDEEQFEKLKQIGIPFTSVTGEECILLDSQIFIKQWSRSYAEKQFLLQKE